MEIVDRSTDRPVTDPAQALQKKGAAAAARTPGPVSTLDSTRARVSRSLAPVLDGPCATTTTRKTKTAKMQTQTQTQMQTDADRAATHLSSISHSTLPACLPTKYADPRRPTQTRLPILRPLAQTRPTQPTAAAVNRNAEKTTTITTTRKHRKTNPCWQERARLCLPPEGFDSARCHRGCADPRLRPGP